MNERFGDAVMESPEFYPERLGELDCSYYVRTGQCKFGSSCRYNHPPDRKLASVNARIRGEYPERPGQPECQYYLKTGICKFGATCKYHHPGDRSASAGRVSLNSLGYPLRPNETECTHYLRTGQCKFGSTCKFHHPQSSHMISQHTPYVYGSVQSPTSPGNQSYAGVPNLSRASLINSPRWEGPSSYTPLIVPQRMVSVPGWNAYNGHVSAFSSADNLKQLAENSQIDTSYFQGEFLNDGSQGGISPYQAGSVPIDFYPLQGEYVFPERPGQPECQYYLKTGDCKFGAVCKFHHPKLRLIPAPNCLLSPMGLPSRPGEPSCIYYTRFGICKFGPSCKFDHPMAISGYDSTVLSSVHEPRHSGSSSIDAAPTLTLNELDEDEEKSPKSVELSLSDSRHTRNDGDNGERET